MEPTQPLLPDIGLGSAPLGGLYESVSHDAGVETVLAAIRAGYRYIDTAPLYGYGRAERIVGDALSICDSQVQISTKVGRLIEPGSPRPAGDMFSGTDGKFVWDFSSDGVRRSLESSLTRLGRDRIDVVFIHDPDQFVGKAINEAYVELERLRSQGLIQAIGIGMNEPTVPIRFVRDTDIDVVLIAGRYTLLDQSADEELFDLATKRGVHIVAAGVFNSGILTGAEATPHYDYAAASNALVERTRALNRICQQFDTDLRTAAIQFVARHPAVGTVLVGARSEAEASENLASLGVELSEEFWTALEHASVD